MKEEQAKPAKNKRRTIQGIVTSTKMQKTIRVEWERKVRDPRFGKFVNRRTPLHAHDEEGKAHVGDLVEIMETRPLSKLKRWNLIRVIREGKIAR